MVFVGIDTHKSSLAVCIVDELGRQLAVESFANDPRGHRRLHAWVSRAGAGERRFGIESSGWLGHGLVAVPARAGRGRPRCARAHDPAGAGADRAGTARATRGTRTRSPG